ncbi:WAT1-related protein At5g07050-like [Phalaenopsis equestris]|uniref:WAT1-related protein At5g07050-like n=1 Tax=Phalaenopsis equestris TaxID=78828 RepID=UPI0009E53459|nr:WAT1-related protein At5g07050-like [Phalaenopsis equestris]
MDLKLSQIGEIHRRFKPHVLMILTQISYTLLYFFTEASFNHGMNPHIYVTYRHVVAGLIMCPFAYFLERKARPKLTWALFLEIFVLSILGVSLTLNMYFASLKCTSPTFVAAMLNTLAALTFIIAVLLRLEIVDIKKAHGKAKVAGTIISLAGVTTMTFYKGKTIRNLWGALILIQGRTLHKNQIKGSILVVLSCITWSMWYIMQAVTLKKYPAQLSLTAWMCLIGGAQSAIFTVLIEHKSEAWHVGFNIDLWNIIYSLWCTEEKGPVFVTMFSPLASVLVALLAYFVFGERMYTGSILGGLIVIIGLYLLLWGKENDKETSEGFQAHSDISSGKQQDENKEKLKIMESPYEDP